MNPLKPIEPPKPPVVITIRNLLPKSDINAHLKEQPEEEDED